MTRESKWPLVVSLLVKAPRTHRELVQEVSGDSHSIRNMLRRLQREGLIKRGQKRFVSDRGIPAQEWVWTP